VAGGWQFLLFILPCFLLFFLFFFLLVSAFLPPSLSVFSSFISTLSPLFFLSVYPLSCAPSFCSPRLPCIYRQKQGRDMDGAIIVQPPHDCPRRHVSFVSPTRGRPRVSLVSGCPWSASFWCFSEEEKSVKTGEQKLSSLVFCTSKGRRRHMVSFKTAPFWVLFLWTVDEMAPFWTKRAVSFKRKRRQKRVKVQISLQFVICSFKSSIVNFDFKNQFNCIPAKFTRRPWS
jgi:hypothetical protein